eukprot:11696843-Alexandrium_andersonii.AAC.1
MHKHLIDALDLNPALPPLDDQARSDWEAFRNHREARASAWRPLSPRRRRRSSGSDENPPPRIDVEQLGNDDYIMGRFMNDLSRQH